MRLACCTWGTRSEQLTTSKTSVLCVVLSLRYPILGVEKCTVSAEWQLYGVAKSSFSGLWESVMWLTTLLSSEASYIISHSSPLNIPSLSDSLSVGGKRPVKSYGYGVTKKEGCDSNARALFYWYWRRTITKIIKSQADKTCYQAIIVLYSLFCFIFLRDTLSVGIFLGQWFQTFWLVTLKMKQCLFAPPRHMSTGCNQFKFKKRSN